MEPIDDDLTWFARNPHRCFRMREATHEERAPLLTEAALIDDMVTSLWSTASNAAQPTGSACSLRQRDFGEPRRECGRNKWCLLLDEQRHELIYASRSQIEKAIT
jgi:hypothetical protein